MKEDKQMRQRNSSDVFRKILHLVLIGDDDDGGGESVKSV